MMRVAIQQLRMSSFGTKGKAQHLVLDDFARYVHAKREEIRATPNTFWPDFLMTLAVMVLGLMTLVAFAIAAPVIRGYLFA